MQLDLAGVSVGEIMDAQHAIECRAAELAAVNSTAADHARLRELIDVDVHCFGQPRSEDGVHSHNPAPGLEHANQALRTLSADLSIAAAADGLDLVHSHTWYANLAGHLAERPAPGCVGISHTRWATHGPANDRTAHPHVGGSGAGAAPGGVACAGVIRAGNAIGDSHGVGWR